MLSSDALDRDLETPAPAMFHERAAQPGEVVAELRGVVKRFEPGRCWPASRPRSAPAP